MTDMTKLTLSTAANRLGLSAHRFKRMLSSGECGCAVHRGCGGVRYVDRAEFEAWLAEREHQRRASERRQAESARKTILSGPQRGVGYVDWGCIRA